MKEAFCISHKILGFRKKIDKILKCFQSARLHKMYRIINTALLYWFYERKRLNSNKM